MKLLIMQNWTAWVLAIWYDILHFNNCFQSIQEINKDQHEAYDAVIKQLSSMQFLQYVEEVHQWDFIYTSWTDHQQADKKFVTMCWYLQEIEIFMTLWYVIAHGDIDLIWWLIDSLCIWFYEAEQSKYKLKMLHL